MYEARQIAKILGMGAIVFILTASLGAAVAASVVTGIVLRRIEERAL